LSVALAVIEVAFDPLLRVQGFAIPWRAIGIAGSVLVALLVAALIARRGEPARSDGRLDRALEAGSADEDAAGAGRRAGVPVVELDDLLYIAVGAVAGAVVLGRLVHGLTYLDVYAPDPMALLDPARGSLSLVGAVVGGALTGAYVASTLGVSVRRCADVAAIPMLLSIGLGKLSLLLAGAGQGSTFDGPWALAFTGPGPWMSLEAGAPAHPSQAYEGLWALLGLPLVLLLGSWAGRRRPARSGAGGALFLVALAWWLVGRIAAGFSWRDDPVVGPLNAEQVLAVAVLAATVLVLLAAVRRAVGADARVAPADAEMPMADARMPPAESSPSQAEAPTLNPDPGSSPGESGTSRVAGAPARDHNGRSRPEHGTEEPGPERASDERGPERAGDERGRERAGDGRAPNESRTTPS
jgi:prolipoprotein diacylglyceryltransferase